MDIETLVDAVYLRVNGGKPSPEDNVLRSDIRVLVPDAVNALMVQFYGSADVNSSATSPLFLQVFESVPIALNVVRGKFEFDLPKRPLSVDVKTSVRFVGLNNGTLFQHFYPEHNTLWSFYVQTRRSLPAYSVEGNSVVLYNVPAGTTSVLVKQLVHIDDYNDGDDIIAPSGTENTLIDILYQRVLAQKQMSTDNIINASTP